MDAATLSAIGSCVSAAATIATGWVIWIYTKETQKIRKAGERQLEILVEQTKLAAQQAAAQSVLTFSFGRCVAGRDLGSFGTASLYAVVVEGRGFQNLEVEVADRSGERFALFQPAPPGYQHDHLQASLPGMTHTLASFGAKNGSGRASTTKFRLTYIDAFRNNRWDEFTFYTGENANLEIKWCGSGLSVSNSLTIDYGIEGTRAEEKV